MKKLSILFLSLGLLVTSCNNTPSAYNPYASLTSDEVANIYNGDHNDFHINTWYTSQFGIVDVSENYDTGVVTTSYAKSRGSEYAHMYTTVGGPFADFTYINIKAKGTPGKSIAMRLCYDPMDLQTSNVLGNDISFSLTEEYSIHTLKVKGTLKTRLDLVNRVCIFPEIGNSGSSIRGEFSISDCWFSKEIPENAKWENTGVDSGDSSANVNGWKTQAWTLYTLYDAGNNKTGITYTQAAEWALVEKEIEINPGDNVINFSFENKKDVMDELSVSHIVFKLSGDVKEHVTENVEYDYYTYYESVIYTYDVTNENEVAPDANGVVNLSLPIATALNDIGSHHENGYRVVMLIESRPDDFHKFEYSRDGHMVINSMTTSNDPNVQIQKYTQYGENTYTLTDKEGVDTNVTYTNVRGDAYWPRLCRHIETEVGQSVEVTIHNNGEEAVRIGLHAGIFIDGRSDSTHNNNFFPLWKNNGRGAQGYFEDGETFDVEPGEDYVVTVSVDTSTEHGVDASVDTINVITFLIDNCYGDDAVRSGDIDLVSFEVI